MHESTGTRDGDTMRAYARGARAAEIRAVLDEAEREHDRALAAILRDELRRRGQNAVSIASRISAIPYFLIHF